MKKKKESTIDDFCKDQEIGPSELARLADVSKVTINNYKSVTKSDHVVRHNAKTGDFQIIRKEQVMAEGNLSTAKKSLKPIGNRATSKKKP